MNHVSCAMFSETTRFSKRTTYYLNKEEKRVNDEKSYDASLPFHVDLLPARQKLFPVCLTYWKSPKPWLSACVFCVQLFLPSPGRGGFQTGELNSRIGGLHRVRIGFPAQHPRHIPRSLRTVQNKPSPLHSSLTCRQILGSCVKLSNVSLFYSLTLTSRRHFAQSAV